MNIDISEVIEFINSQLKAKNLQGLRDIETAIIEELWQDKSLNYTEIAENTSFAEGTIKNKASELWKRLSEVFSVEVKKSNFTSIIKINYNKIITEEIYNQTSLDEDDIDRSIYSQYQNAKEKDYLEKKIQISQIEKTLREKTNWGQKRLFGIEKILDKLGENLQSPDDYWLMSLTGAGGIGKTSLTEKLVSEYADDGSFVKLAWTTAKINKLEADMSVKKRHNRIDIDLNVDTLLYDIATQLDIYLPPANRDHFPALRRKLRSDPYLIVIDNLETLADYERLLDRFNPFDPDCHIRPSKVILTSRKDVKANNVGVREKKILGLDRSATLEMIRYEAQELDIVKQASDEELEAIYQKTKGNPLMILLIVSLLINNHEPLDKIFERFEANQEMQDFLYVELVLSLSQNARDVLTYATQFSPNSLIEHSDLQQTSGLNDDEFIEARNQCIKFNLLDSSRSSVTSEARYSIHSLLYKFLRRIINE
ncbi:NB-ARC domain protein [Lyngbya aestuarii BL J]|uniref:NB-ARC domain protein n=1 Tax=Lyngbya aestuarii BL J TaxID=1348334 RepID=U7QFZ7_9CYAN|nr:NB-ARC domain-containing protein [Lyngbya aestuarii]ERT06833.1 NB-ARC domain protein [Lyngbya aestuarii BL J]